ncbi:MAG: hypothetical protein J6X46_00245 [Prevotella sp.]|nr:hypothetical protein [Prevotella sp.]
MLIVIADDLTGAAEMAGVAWSKGLSVNMVMQVSRNLPPCDVLIVATDTRQATKKAAVKTVEGILQKITSPSEHLVFKKTDSALRGHIVAEIKAMMYALDKDKALLMAQNPSKGRIIKDGVYYLDDLPLDRSLFFYDPEFPANSSVVEERLPGTQSLSLEDSLHKGINVADGSTKEELLSQLQKADTTTLLAGAADAFSLILDESFEHKEQPSSGITLDSEASLLLIQGSTQSRPNPWHIPETLMPDDVFHGAEPKEWIESLKEQFREHPRMAVRIAQPSEGGKSYAVRLREVMTTVASQLIKIKAAAPLHLIIEGGATAYAIIQHLGWNTFSIERELAPGIVTIRHKQNLITLKPGSYLWPL